MRTVHTVSELRAIIHRQREKGVRIALVPTMGNLHEGHLSLVKEACVQGDFVVASIFVNPMQFGPNEDLDAYPRTLQEDQEKLSEAGCDLVFAPPVSEVYPEGMGHQTQVSVPDITELHCGASRPGHFTGVATVVTMLFNMVQPDSAIFGQKDFQQLAVIRKMVRDLFMPVKIVGAATVREKDGLAMSSRNGYLSEDERARAPALYRCLSQTADAIKAGNRNFGQLQQDANETLKAQGFEPDYFNIVHRDTLRPAAADDPHIAILAAAKLGTTRLIDNVTVDL
ncbi:pantoate--beta-alanine ligase [Marinobacteraceae bacterium S3BR75-40.1]